MTTQADRKEEVDDKDGQVQRVEGDVLHAELARFTSMILEHQKLKQPQMNTDKHR
jgi:hypothetical protein